MVGKIIVIWLLIVGLLGIATMDAASILFARFKLSDAAQTAAVTGATNFQNRRDVDLACRAARDTLPDGDDITIPKTFCKVSASTGEVTITVRTEADTVLAGRLGFTSDLTKIEIEESGRPSSL
jgi:flagellar basal body rod protein FlgG